MKAVRCCDRHPVVVDIPPPVGDGVRVKVKSAGICSSDLHMLALGFNVPGTLGHEVAGVLPDGRAVAIEPLSPCGHCDMCVRGDYHVCRRGPAMVHGVGCDGGMAEEILVPERAIVPLPSNIRAEDACLVEPLAVAVHGLRWAGVQPGQRVAVVGAGPIGLCATAMLTHHLRDVALVARHDAQKSAGERLGAKLEPTGEYDVVAECAGTATALRQAAQLCKPGGVVLLLATYWQGVEFPALEVGFKSLRVYGSSLYNVSGLARDVDVAARLLAVRPELPQLLISHRLPLDAAAEGFALAADRAAGAIKVVLEP